MERILNAYNYTGDDKELSESIQKIMAKSHAIKASMKLKTSKNLLYKLLYN